MRKSEKKSVDTPRDCTFSQIQMNRENIVTVFTQGNRASRSQGAKYAGKNGIAIGGPFPHRAIAPNAPFQLMYNPYCYDESDDISYEFSWNPIHLIDKAISRFRNWYNGVEQPYLWHTVWSKMSVGGAHDIELFKTAVDNCAAEMEGPEKKMVLYGVSRGAATVFTSVTQMSEMQQAMISLVILEAPFDMIEHVTNPLTRMFLSTFTAYNPKQTSPFEVAKKWPKHIPIVFIVSASDKTVPYSQTFRLIYQLINNGHRKLKILLLEKGGHNDMAREPEYKEFIEKMYDKYCAPSTVKEESTSASDND